MRNYVSLEDDKLIDRNENVIRDNLSYEMRNSFELRGSRVIGRKGRILDKQGHQMTAKTKFYEELYLTYEDLRDIKFDGFLVLPYADLLGANLSVTDSGRVDLSGANLSGADLRFANLAGIILVGADLTDVDATGAYVEEIWLDRAILTNALFRDERGFNLVDGIHLNGTRYDDRGFDIDKVHQNGTLYNNQGFDLDGYDSTGFDAQGYDRAGFDRSGWDSEGFGSDGYNSKGRDRDGYFRDGMKGKLR